MTHTVRDENAAHRISCSTMMYDCGRASPKFSHPMSPSFHYSTATAELSYCIALRLYQVLTF